MHKSTRIILTFAAAALCAVLITGCSAKARMARHQQRGDAYFAAGDYSKAEIEYLIALKFGPGNPHSISRLADIYYEQGRLLRAYAYVAKACELVTNDVDMHVKLGTIYIEARKLKEARGEAEFVLERSPTNSEAPEILAESVSSRAELDQVQKRLERLSKQIGDTAPIQVAFAVLAYAQGDITTAETDLQHALSINPKYGAAYYTLGNLYVRQNKLKEADAAFKTAADLAPVRSMQRLGYANFKMQTGDLAEGKRLLAQISKEAPDYIPAWIRQAQVAIAEKKYDDSEALLNQALSRDPDNYEAWQLRGRLYVLKGQPDKAVAELDRMTAAYPSSPEVLYDLAVAHVAAKDVPKASADLNKALFLRPKYPEATLLLASLDISKGDTASAVGVLTQLLRDQPTLAQAYLLLGQTYTIQKNYDQALAIYSKLAELYPKNAQVPLLIGMVQVQKKNPAAARKAFEKALELSPTMAVAQEELVNLDIEANQFDAALDRVNKQTDEKEVVRQILLAKIYTARARSVARQQSKGNDTTALLKLPAVQGDVNQAEAALLKAVDLAPSRETPYLLLAQLYVSAGKDQQALDRLNGLLSKTNSAAAYMQIGAIYDARKDYAKARDAYEKVIEMKPNFGAALNNLSYIYSERLVDVDKAYTLAERARDLSPDAATSDTLGWVLYKKGEYQRARGLLEESANAQPDQPEIQLHVGMARYMMGDENSARAALQEAAAATEDFPEKELAARHLAIMAIDPKTADAKTQADLEKRLQDEPNDPIAANRLAGIYEKQGALDKAAKTYEQSLKQNPQNGQTMGRLARIYLELNQTDKALDLAKDAHKLLPDDAAISCLLGRLVFQTGDYNWAASLLQEAAPRLPSEPEVQYYLAWSYYSVGRVSEAKQTMQTAAAGLTGPEQADAKLFLALVPAVNAPTAAAQASQVLKTNSDYVPAIMVSAVQAEQQGKADDAASLYQKALAHYPAFWPAARNFAVLAAQHPGGDDQKAYDLGVKARTMYADDANLERALGVLAYRRGDYSRAAQLLDESSQTLSNDGELFYYLGMAQYQLKHMPQSKAALQRALTLNIQTKSAEDAKKVLAELK